MSERGKFSSTLGVRLQRRDDEFSHQFSLPDDPIFWIRIARPVTPVTVVTDMNFGAVSLYDMAGLFADTLSQLGLERSLQLSFTNLGAPDDLSTAQRTVQIERMIEAFLSGRPLFLTGRQISFDRDKATLLLELKSAVS